MNGVEDQVILDVKTDIPTFIYLFIYLLVITVICFTILFSTNQGITYQNKISTKNIKVTMHMLFLESETIY